MLCNFAKFLAVLLAGFAMTGVLAAPMPMPSDDLDVTTAVNGTIRHGVHPISDTPCRGCIRELHETVTELL